MLDVKGRGANETLVGKRSAEVLHNTVRLYLHSGARGAHQLARLVERVPFSDKAKLEHALLEKAYVEARQLEMCVEALWWMESGGSRGTHSLRIHD